MSTDQVISTLVERIDSLSTRLAKVDKENIELIKEIAELKTKIAEVKKENIELKTKNAELKGSFQPPEKTIVMSFLNYALPLRDTILLQDK